ncbi:hypothetical protein FB45DRAFT_849141 [Roridomyces roridus]|uniref:Uncharacterized protein n=1 Tax=Roridomyces roridus TaxID=1738132 RepID=A0AAD7AZQ5_9AGAR|nr:hypothetical protein FB45DRAFT_849141 [Roridomyces roridus]
MQWLSSIVQRRSKWGAPPTSITQGSDSKLDPSLGSEKPIPPPSILPTATLPLPAVSTTTKSGFRDIVEDILFTSSVLVDTVSRQIYLHFLLRIPSLYFTRVTRIFEDAQLSLPDIKKMARARAEQWNPAENPAWTTTFIQQPNLKEPLPRSLLIFRANWENFIDDLMSEWQTLNIISVLLMSAILTMLQIDAASHPITRTSALFSLICALMSLLYGCLYIIRFGTMRKMHKASSFADEAQKSTTSIWWNVWVLLAMPAVWLAWAIVVFFVCIMSFVWLSGSSNNPSTFASSPRAALGIRIALTVVFSLGLIYFMLIVRTFHRYGDLLDREWMRRVNEWSKEVWSAPQARPVPTPYPLPPDLPPRKLVPRSPLIKPKKRTVLSPDDGKPIPVEVLPEIKEEQKFDKVPDFVPLTSPPPEFFKPFGPVLHPSGLGGESHRVMQLGYHDVEARQSSGEPPSWAQTIEWGDLNRFAVDISNAWNGRIALDYEDAVSGYHDTRELPAYTLVSAARLDTPLPDEGDPLVNFADLGQETASESGSSSSSYGNVIEPTDNTLGRPEASASSSDSASPPLVVQTHSHSPSPPGTPPVNTRALSRSLSPPPPSRPPDNYIDSTLVETVREFVALWNEWYFHPRNIEASLVLLESPEPGGFVYAINLGMRPPMLEPIMRQKDDQEEAEPAGKSGGKAGTVRDPESSGPQIG